MDDDRLSREEMHQAARDLGYEIKCLVGAVPQVSRGQTFEVSNNEGKKWTRLVLSSSGSWGRVLSYSFVDIPRRT